MFEQTNRTPLKIGSILDGGDGKKFRICRVLNAGGSAITYDAAVVGNDAKHYAIKELYPLRYADLITREEQGTLLFGFTDDTKRQALIAEFKKEAEFLKSLPASNSDAGQYFFYSEAIFEANNTAYMVMDTTSCMVLRKWVKKNKPSLESLIRVFLDVCNALEMLYMYNNMQMLHLDISDSNIVVAKNGTAMLLDFGSAVKLTDLHQKEKMQGHRFSYNEDFSPIEIKAAAQGGYYDRIGVQSDLYSVCAVLFKCLIGRAFDPVYDRECPAQWKHALLKKWGRGAKELTTVLEKGLSGFDARYNSALTLGTDLLWAKVAYKTYEKRYRFSIFTAVAMSAVLLVLAFTWLFWPVPQLELTLETGEQYFMEDEIRLTCRITDPTGVNDAYLTSLDNAIVKHGFDGDLFIESHALTSQDEITYNLVFTDLVFYSEGEKSIEVGSIYKTEFFRKRNPTRSISFFGYTDRPAVTVSAPSYTSVNAGDETELSYDVTIDVPQNAEYTVSLDHVRTLGFTAETIQSEQISEKAWRLYFTGIQGEPGECRLEIPAGTVALENGAASKATESPSFEIVEEWVPNYPIHVELSVVAQDLRPGGFILLKPTAFHTYTLSSRDDWDIHTIGFHAARIQYPADGRYIFLSNLEFNAGTDGSKVILIDAGAFVSTENGSISDEVYLDLLGNDTYGDETSDRTFPIFVNLQNDKVVPGENLYLNICSIDGAWPVEHALEDAVLESGFSFESRQIARVYDSIFVFYTNVQPTGNDVTPQIEISEDTFTDYIGSHFGSKTVDFRFES